MVSTGTSEVVSGVPALLVLTMSTEPSDFLTSQVQPEPKLPTALAEKASLNLSKLPHFLLMASASAPLGAPPPCGDRQDQKKVWFQTWAALLKTPPWEERMISTRSLFSNSVPAISLLRLVT